MDEEILKLPDDERKRLLQLLLFSWIGTSGACVIQQYNLEMQPRYMSKEQFQKLASKCDQTPLERLILKWQLEVYDHGRSDAEEKDRAITCFTHQHKWVEMFSGDPLMCVICGQGKETTREKPWWYCECISVSGVHFPHEDKQKWCTECHTHNPNYEKNQPNGSIGMRTWSCYCLEDDGRRRMHLKQEMECLYCGRKNPHENTPKDAKHDKHMSLHPINNGKKQIDTDPESYTWQCKCWSMSDENKRVQRKHQHKEVQCRDCYITNPFIIESADDQKHIKHEPDDREPDFNAARNKRKQERDRKREERHRATNLCYFS